MGDNITLSVPSIVVNNIPWHIVPNSFKYDGGEGVVKVRSASAGGGSAKSVHSQDAETMIGKCSFDVYLTPGVDSEIKTLKSRIGANSIEAVQASESGQSVTLSWDNMSLAGSVERVASADGTTTLEFEGDQMA